MIFDFINILLKLLQYKTVHPCFLYWHDKESSFWLIMTFYLLLILFCPLKSGIFEASLDCDLHMEDGSEIQYY